VAKYHQVFYESSWLFIKFLVHFFYRFAPRTSLVMGDDRLWQLRKSWNCSSLAWRSPIKVTITNKQTCVVQKH